jgi:peptide/nickel transport system substrate-binding protein
MKISTARANGSPRHRAIRRAHTLIAALVLVVGAAAACTSNPDATPADTGAPAVSNAGNTGGQASSSGSTEVSSGTSGGSLNVELNQDPTTFNPLLGFTAGSQQVMGLIFDSLLTTGSNLKFEPRLAASWDISSDAKTFTFHLHPGMKWSDGKPFSSADVVFSYNVYADPAVASPQSGRLSEVEGFDAFQKGTAKTLAGVTAPNANTVVFKLSKPDAGFLSLIGFGAAFYIMPEHVLGSVPRNSLIKNGYFNKPTVGMGPFDFVSYTPGEQVVLRRNPDFRTPAKVDMLYLKIVTSNVATSEIGSGELDLAQINTADLKTVQGFSGVSTHEATSPGFNRLAVNTTKPELANKLVRQAMLYAIDRAGIIKTVYGGLAKPINTAFMTSWAIPKNLNTYPYDPDKAKQLLQQAHWNPSTSITLSWASGRADWDQIATIIIADLKAVGMDVKAQQTNGAGLTADLDHKSFDLILYDGGTYPPDPATDFPILACSQVYPAGGNITYYCNHQMDAAMIQGAQTADQSARATAYQKAARIENDEAPMIWLNVEPTIWATSSKLTGFVPFGDYTNAFVDAAAWGVSG